MIYLGVDPGKSGAIATITENGVTVCPVPLIVHGEGRPEYDLAAIRNCLRGRESAALVVVERLDSLPVKDGDRQLGGAFANYARGESKGWAWMLTAIGLPFQLVRPQTWQAAMLKGTPKTAGTKARSIMAAQQLFPGVSLLPGPRARKPSDGFADALLLAEYARRIHTGGELFAAAERVQTSADKSEPEDVFAE